MVGIRGEQCESAHLYQPLPGEGPVNKPGSNLAEAQRQVFVGSRKS